MSGAEAIGFAAAALQFADVGWRVALALLRLFSDLQHVTTKMKNAKRDLELLLTFLEMLKSGLGLTTSGSTSTLNGVIISAQSASALSHFEECIDQAQELERILTQLGPNTHKGLKRAWRAAVSVKTEHEIISKCVRLEGLKMSLNHRHDRVNLLLLKTRM